MPVAERGDRMTAVKIENLPTIARREPHAMGCDDLERVLREDGREIIHLCHHVHPGAGAVRPVVSGRPKRRFIHCTAPPAAPLVRLSMAHSTATVRPFATADRCA